MRRAAVLLNPVSGRGLGDAEIGARVALARDTLAAAGVEASVHVTEGVGDAAVRARDAAQAGAEVVVAWGGDGTVNEVGAALAFGSVPMAIVPGGSGNGLATDLGLPRDPQAALARAATGATRAIDAGEVGGSLFFNVAGIGLDARIAARFAARGRHQRGFAAYVRLTTAELLQARASGFTVTLPGEAVRTRAFFVAIANSRQYGQGAIIAPQARVDDGRLEIVVVEEQSLLRIAVQIPGLFRGTLGPRRGLIMRSTATGTIAGDAPLLFHVDGEPRQGTAELAVRTHPAALSLRM